MQITRIGLDLAKTVFQLHAVDCHDKLVQKRQLKRNQVLPHFANLPSCIVAMEACGGAHFWARMLRQLGHEVRLIAPQHVKPYVRGNKNDANDAAAICEAAGRPDMRLVAIKEIAQQDIQAIHRIRSDLNSCRTAKGNHIRGLLAEYGIAIDKSPAALRKTLPRILEDAENQLTPTFRRLLSDLKDDLARLDERVSDLDKEIAGVAAESEMVRKLQHLPGVGPVIATALIAALGNGHQFRRGREVSVWCGLTPSHKGTGGRITLGGISKRGDAYLRTLLIHGARSVVNAAKKKDDALSRWIQALCARRNKNVAAVALANKTLRRAWALLTSGEDYRDTTPEVVMAA